MEAGAWDRLVASFPDPHLFQTMEWGQFKSEYGWKVLFMVWGADAQLWTGEVVSKAEGDIEPNLLGCPKAAALVLWRGLSLYGIKLPFKILYIPKGPLLDWQDESLREHVLTDLQKITRQQRAIFCKIDPDVLLGYGIPSKPGFQDKPVGSGLRGDLLRLGWSFSEDQVQFRNTIQVDLAPSESELLSQMKQKTRYNVNLASRKGVTVRYGNEADFEMLYRMYCETCTRDGFIIRDEVYYRRLWETFLNKRPSETDGVIPSAEILIAEVNGEAVAGLVLFYFAGKAYYLQGMSRHIHKDKMPNYLLQWEAIRRARLKGCRVYDLWGAPDEFHEQDRLWGVFRFKEGFGGRLVRTIGAWDWAAQPMSYRLYAHILPRLLEVMRRRSRIRTRQMIPL